MPTCLRLLCGESIPHRGAHCLNCGLTAWTGADGLDLHYRMTTFSHFYDDNPFGGGLRWATRFARRDSQTIQLMFDGRDFPFDEGDNLTWIVNWLDNVECIEPSLRAQIIVKVQNGVSSTAISEDLLVAKSVSLWTSGEGNFCRVNFTGCVSDRVKLTAAVVLDDQCNVVEISAKKHVAPPSIFDIAKEVFAAEAQKRQKE